MGVLQWTRAKTRDWDVETTGGATFEVHFEVLKWAWPNGCP